MNTLPEENKLEFHLANIPLAVIEWDNKLIIRRWSKQAEEIFGWTAKEAIGKNISKLGLADETVMEVAWKDASNPAHEEKTGGVVNRNYSKNKRLVYCEWNYSVLNDDAGKMQSILALVQDVTGKKNAEEALKESEEKYRALVEYSHDAICMINNDWEIVYRSPSAEKMTGFNLDDLRGKKFFNLVHPDDRVETIKFYKELFNEPGIPKYKSHRILHEDGHYIWAEGTIINMLHHPNVAAIISNFRDITEKKKAEEELTMSETRYRALIDQASDAIMITNQKGDYVDVNLSTCEMFGYTREELLGLNVNKLIDPNQLKDDPIRNDLLLKGHSILRERRMMHKNGSIVEVEANVKLLPDGRLLAIARDITERKKIQQELMATSARLKFIFDTLDISFWGFDMIQNKMLYVSPGNKKIYGYDDSYFLNNPDFRDEIILPDDKKLFENVFKELRKGKGALLQHRINHADGTVHWIEARITPAMDSSGNLVRVDGIALDITEQKNAEEAIRTSERKYKLMFNKNPFPMWVACADSMNFIDVNESAIQHYGYTREEFLSMNAKDIRPEEDLEAFHEHLRVRSGEKTLGGIWRHRKKDGTIIKVDIIAHSILHEGRPSRLILASDVTEKILADEKLKESYEQLRQLSSHLQSIREEERTAIAREIHDELGQQLTALKMDASWLNKKIPQSDQATHEKISAMIHLLDETMKTVRRISTELRPGILDDLGLVDALDWQSHEFEKRTGIRCVFKSGSADMQFEKNISTGIFRIYQEALTNVARHAKATELKTSFEMDADHVILSVHDNGQGFDKAESKNKKTLGLVGMKERAAMFNARLIIESSKGKGTSIHLEVPVAIALADNPVEP